MAQTVTNLEFLAPRARTRTEYPLTLIRAASTRQFAGVIDEKKPLVVVVESDTARRFTLLEFLHSIDVNAIAFASADELLEARLRDQPGCFILDAKLSGWGGLALYERLNASGLFQPAIFLTEAGHVALTVRAMRAGALDVVPKHVSANDLEAAVNSAIIQDCERRDAAQLLHLQIDRVAALTPRELQVLEGVALGRLNKQIAFDLGISEITVKAHRGSVMRKLCARSVCDLVRTWDSLPPQLYDIAGRDRQIVSIVQ